jgi:hypothetical protein
LAIEESVTVTGEAPLSNDQRRGPELTTKEPEELPTMSNMPVAGATRRLRQSYRWPLQGFVQAL